MELMEKPKWWSLKSTTFSIEPQGKQPEIMPRPNTPQAIINRKIFANGHFLVAPRSIAG
jgi:hypothetical protein